MANYRSSFLCLYIHILVVASCFGQKTYDKNFLVEIIPIDSIYLTQPYTDKLKRDSISKKYSNWHQLSRALENYLLNIENPGISRNHNDHIEIKLVNGQVVKLIPDETTEEVDFIFEHHFKQQQYLLFRVQWNEGNNYALIDRINGQKTYLPGTPFFSPDNRFVMAINFDIEPQYSANGFQLFEIVNRNFIKIWEYDPISWGPVELMWMDRRSLNSKNLYYDSLGGIKSSYTKINITSRVP